jgi:hypothetical protein
MLGDLESLCVPVHFKRQKDDWGLESSRCFAKGFQVSDFAQAVVT